MIGTHQGPRKLRLLLIEDNTAQRRTLTEILTDEGLEVVACATASETLESLEESEFGVAVLDLRLPDLDGISLLKQIKDRQQHVRVIIHTAFGSYQSAKDALNSGAFAYVEKPYDPEELTRIAHRAFEDLLSEELEESEARAVSIVENAVDAIITFDKRGVIESVNPAAEKMFGYAGGEMIGRNVAMIMPEPYRARHKRSLQRYRATGEKRVIGSGRETEGLRKDGTTFPVELTIAEVPVRNRRLFMGMIRDISQRKRAEEALRQREMELAHVARLGTLGEMVAAIAHDVNQPLSAISNFANACRRTLLDVDGLRNRDLVEWVEKIGKAATQAGEITRRLGRFARRSDARRERMSIEELVDESLELIGFQLRNHKVTVTVLHHPDANALAVIVDRVQIEQVMVNLLQNASEAMHDLPPEKRHIGVSTSRSADAVQIAIRDRGAGLSPQTAAKMFDAFFTTKKMGMGMGLAISKRIVEKHSGRLWWTPNREGGSTFQFSLPLRE